MDWLYSFPLQINIDYEAIDSTVTGWSIRFDSFLEVLQGLYQIL